MNSDNKKEKYALFKGVLMAHFILVLHALLIAGLGFLVLFFRGIIQYMLWIFLIGSAGIITSAVLFYKRMKKEGMTLREMLNSPLFRGRSVEVHILGGLASFKLGKSDDAPMIENGLTEQRRQLEDPDTIHVRELRELSRLLEKQLITVDEYNKAKRRLFKS
jgi:hypothetical protein